LQVLGAEVVGDKVQLKVEASKGGKPETMEADVVLVSIGEPQ
jgi:dihydrolipoamide dehydrogenase